MTFQAIFGTSFPIWFSLTLFDGMLIRRIVPRDMNDGRQPWNNDYWLHILEFFPNEDSLTYLATKWVDWSELSSCIPFLFAQSKEEKASLISCQNYEKIALKLALSAEIFRHLFIGYIINVLYAHYIHFVAKKQLKRNVCGVKNADTAKPQICSMTNGVVTFLMNQRVLALWGTID